ncbi:30S ribosomal protein S16 [Buchnera aphidicola (Formosaphis micheliae)]|uniref:30S ribosomal protein S16 n=1 Tax=Buchnera aphidicola TaxID=9 RepID=UPI0031B827BC
MLKIRLARHGSKKRPFYQIIVTDSRFPRNGRFLERIGYFNPIYSSITSQNIYMNNDRINYWIQKGAIMSQRTYTLIKKYKKINISK